MWLELGIYQKNVAIFMENCKINPWKIMDGMSALGTKPCETSWIPMDNMQSHCVS